MANVKVSEDKQNGKINKRTDEHAKKYMPPIYRCGSIKITHHPLQTIVII